MLFIMPYGFWQIRLQLACVMFFVGLLSASELTYTHMIEQYSTFESYAESYCFEKMYFPGYPAPYNQFIPASLSQRKVLLSTFLLRSFFHQTANPGPRNSIFYFDKIMPRCASAQGETCLSFYVSFVDSGHVMFSKFRILSHRQRHYLSAF